MKKNMQMVIKHISENFVSHVLHKLSHSWVILPIEMESNTATKMYLKSLFFSDELAKLHHAGDA